jgi:hypothetical protein
VDSAFFFNASTWQILQFQCHSVPTAVRLKIPSVMNLSSASSVGLGSADFYASFHGCDC